MEFSIPAQAFHFSSQGGWLPILRMLLRTFSATQTICFHCSPDTTYGGPEAIIVEKCSDQDEIISKVASQNETFQLVSYPWVQEIINNGEERVYKEEFSSNGAIAGGNSFIGIPLLSFDGICRGVILIIGEQYPMGWTNEQMSILQEVRAAIEAEMSEIRYSDVVTPKRIGLTKSQIALFEREHSLLKVLRASNTATWQYDMRHSRLEIFNDAYDIFSSPSLGESFSLQGVIESWMYGEDISIAWNAITQALKNGGIFEFEGRVLSRFGKIRYTRQVGLVELDSKNSPLRVVGLVFDITDAKHRELALQESESRYRALFEQSNDAVFLLESNKIVQCNQRSLRLFSAESKNSFLGRHLWDFSPAPRPDGSLDKDSLVDLLSGSKGNMQPFEWVFHRFNGETFTAGITLLRVPYEGKTLLMAVLTDLTEHRAIARTMDAYRAYLAVLADARKFFFGRSEEEIIEAFIASVEIHFKFSKIWYGVSEADIVKPTLHAGIARSYVDIVRANIYENSLSDGAWIGGSRITNALKNSPIVSSATSVFPLCQAIRDGQPVTIQQLENDVRFAAWRSFVLQSRVRSLAAIPFEVDGRRVGGFVFYSPFENHFDNTIVDYLVSGVRELARIIAEKKLWERHQMALLEAKDKAESAANAKMRFLANMSHEIRTPMTAILGYAETFLDMEASLEQRNDAAITIRNNGEFLLSIISDFLDFSKLDADKFSILCSPIDLPIFLRDLVLLYSKAAAKKGLFFSIKCPTLIPESISSDPTRLKQVLFNLIGNAVKFTHQGGITLSISWVPDDTAILSSTENINGSLRFDIVDTGIGISKDNIAHLFTPFQQADSSTTRRYGGTGLGLAISHRLVQLMGGSIHIESDEKSGSTFSVVLPISVLPDTKWVADDVLQSEYARKKSIAEDKKDLSPFSLKDKRILLVEDSLDNSRLFKLIMQRAGADVLLAENGLEAIKIIDENTDGIDLILLDMLMPVMDGYTAAKKLREKGVKTPIIALTALSMREEQEKCLQAGCDSFLSKPIFKVQLLNAIRDALNVASSEA